MIRISGVGFHTDMSHSCRETGTTVDGEEEDEEEGGRAGGLGGREERPLSQGFDKPNS